MKTMILAAAAVAALGVGSAYAGEGGTTAGYDLWQAENGNPTIPATQWFAQQQAAPSAQGRQYAYVMPPFRASQDNGQG